MRAARLDRRVEFLRPEPAIDTTTGQSHAGFVTDGAVWAEVRPVRAGEGFAAQQRFAEAELEVLIRWRSGVGPTWRVVHDGLTYEVLGVVEVGRREGLRIFVRGRAEPEHEPSD